MTLHKRSFAKEIWTVQLILLTLSLINKYASGESVNVTYPDDFLLGVDDVSISCIPLDFADVNIIQLRKNGTNMFSVLFNKSLGTSYISWQDEVTKERQGINATGTVLGSPYLNLSILAPSTLCSDGASYQCVVSGTGDSGGSISANLLFNIKTLNKPTSTEPIVIMPATDVTGQTHVYDVNTTITLSCTGTVGNPPMLHRWCYKQKNDTGFMLFSNSSLTNSRATNSSVIHQNVSLDLNDCQYTRTSSIHYDVTKDDVETTFWCEDAFNITCGEGLSSSKVIIRLRGSSPGDGSGGSGSGSGGTGSGNGSGGSSSNQTTDDTSNVGIIAGSVIGGVVVLFIVFIVIYKVTSRKSKSAGDNYAVGSNTEVEVSGTTRVKPNGSSAMGPDYIYSTPDKLSAAKGGIDKKLTDQGMGNHEQICEHVTHQTQNDGLANLQQNQELTNQRMTYLELDLPKPLLGNPKDRESPYGPNVYADIQFN